MEAEDLECSLCKDMFRNPKTLKCLHSFCSECLEVLVERTSQTVQLSCPICRSPFEVPEGGIEALPTNVFIANQVEAFVTEVEEEERKAQLCVVCARDGAFLCLDCESHYCVHCQRTHKSIRRTKDHRMVSLEDMKNAKNMYCKKHPDHELLYYCVECIEPICRECVAAHEEHEIDELSEIGDDLKAEIKELLDATEPRTIELEDAIKQIDEMMTEIEIQSTSTENSICTAFNQIRKIIEERESALLNELDQIQKVKKKELGLQKDDLKFGIESIKGCCSLTAKTLEKASDIEVFLSTKQMVTRLKYLQNAKWKSKPIQDSFINFSFFNKETKILSEIPKLGIITTNHADPGECQLDGVYDLMRKQLQVNYPVTFTITAFSKDGRRITKGGEKFMVSITGDEETQHDAPTVEDMEDGTYIVSFIPRKKGSYEITVSLKYVNIDPSPVTIQAIEGRDYFSIENKFQSSFGSKGSQQGQFDSPRSVAINSLGQIIVAEVNNHRVQVFDENGNFLFMFGSQGNGDKQFNEPKGICVDDFDNIYVADTKNHRIQIFKKDGEFLRKFGSNGDADGQFQAPHGIILDTDGNIFVANFDDHKVQKFDNYGRFLKKFGHLGNSNGEFDHPIAIAINSKNHVIVSEWSNHRVQIFDTNGNYLSKFGEKGTEDGLLDSPWYLGTDKNDQIIVADCDNNRVQVFDADGNFVTKIGSEILVDPSGIAIDSRNGKVIVADTGNNRILIF